MRVVVIENEPQAQETLTSLIRDYCPGLHISGVAESIAEARHLIARDEPQLVFLDVELNNESGFDLFEHFPSPDFEVIFTTAHQEYALQAIKYSCLDYLLKPIDFRDLQQAIDKSKNRDAASWQNKIKNLMHNLQQKTGAHKLAVPCTEGYEFIPIDNIIMALAEGNYTRIFASNTQILSSRTLGEFESLLPGTQFFRSHKSYLINWDHLERYNKTENVIQLKNGLKAELASRKKEAFINRIKES